MRFTKNNSFSRFLPLLFVLFLLNISNTTQAQRVAAGLDVSAALHLNLLGGDCGMQVSISSNIPSCDGNTVCLAIAGGVAPYKIHVDGASHSSSLLGLAVCIEHLRPGDHTIKVIDSRGCETSLNLNIPSLSDLLRPVIKPVTCHGGGDGSISLDFSLLVGIDISTLLCRWEGPNGYHGEGREVYDLRPGRYSVRILAIGNICIGTGSWEVRDAEPININISIANAACGTANACAYISGGKPPYKIWGFNALPGSVNNSNFLDFINPDSHRPEDCTVYNPTTNTSPFCVNDLSAGYYYILVQDANGCYGWQVFKINPSARFQRQVKVEHISCHGEHDGKICFDIQGNTPPYKTTLAKSTGNAIQTIEGTWGCFENLTAGEYLLTTTDGGGCTSKELIKIMEPDRLEATFELETNNCQDGASGCLKINGGTRPYRVYAWFHPNADPIEIGYNNDGTPYILNAERCNYFNFPLVWSPTSEFCAHHLPPGKYILLIVDANNCFEKIVIDIPALNNLEAKFELTSSACDEQASGCLTIEGGAQPYKVFVFNSNNLLTVIPTVQFDATGRPHLTRCNPTEWQWSTPGIAPPYQICANDIPPGYYWIVVVDQNGCYKLLQVNVPRPNKILLKTRVQNVSCNGEHNGKIYLTIEGGEAPYTIYFNGNLEANGPSSNRNIVFDSLQVGIYKIDVKDKNGCSAWAEVKITEPDPLSAVFISNASDACSSITGGCVKVQGGTAPYRVRFWRPNDPTNINISVHFNVTTNNFEIEGAIALNIAFDPSSTANRDNWCVNNLQPGDYWILVADKNGCYTVLPLHIDEPNNLRVRAEVLHAACNAVGGKIKLHIKGGEAPYQVKMGDRSLTTSDSIVWLENVPPGTYQIWVYDSRPCNTDIVVTVKTEPIQANLHFDKFGEWACANPSGGTSPYKIEWTQLETNAIISNDSCAYDLAPGVYLLTVYDQSGCSTQQWFVIDSQPCDAGIVKIDREWINSGESNTFKWIGGSNGNIQWQFRTEFTDWIDISGATTSIFTTPPIHVAMDEVIFVRVKVECANGGIAYSAEKSFKVRGNNLLNPIDRRIADPQLFNPAFRQTEVAILQQNQTNHPTTLVYPTISRDWVKVRFGENFSTSVNIYVVSSLGAVVYQTQQDHIYKGEAVELPVHQFAPGTYFVRIESGQQVETQRIIVQ